jgi:hypothetical protein
LIDDVVLIKLALCGPASSSLLHRLEHALGAYPGFTQLETRLEDGTLNSNGSFLPPAAS